MSGAGLKLLELIILPSLVFAWGFWELHKLRKDKQKRQAEKKARTAQASGDSNGNPAAP